MSDSNIFGPIVDRDLIEVTVKDFISKWADTYLNEIERIKVLSSGTIPRFRSYTQVNKFERWTEEQLPALLVVSPGLAGPPLKNGKNIYRAKWTLGIGIIVAAKDEDTNRRLIGYYTAAIRALFTHRPSIDGFAIGCSWLGENYNDTPEDYRRSTSSGQVLFELEVDAVVQGLAGPATADPPPDPVPDPGDWPEVIDVSAGATFTKEPIV